MAAREQARKGEDGSHRENDLERPSAGSSLSAEFNRVTHI